MNYSKLITLLLIILLILINIGQSTDASANNKAPTGSTTFSVKDTGYEKEQETRATIGQGTIIVGGVEQTDDDLTGLNRDVNNAQEITKDMITAALDGSVTIDNRVFTEEGRTEIVDIAWNKPIEEYEKKSAAAKEMFGEDTDLGLMPGLWQGDAYMGRQTYELSGDIKITTEAFNIAYEGRTPNQLSLWEKFTSTFDINPGLGLLYNLFPGGKAGTLIHDEENKDVKDPLILMKTIPSSFINTWYSIIYGKHQGKIKNYFEQK